MSAGAFAAPFKPRERKSSDIHETEYTLPPSDAELAHRAWEQVRVKALLDAEHATDLMSVLGLEA